MGKALREAKAWTNWSEPNQAYEQAVREFIIQVLDRATSSDFLDDFLRFARRISYFGQFNSLAQVLLKATSPGVPDFYQGTELWDFTLVDPDNRRPVDYALRWGLWTDLRTRQTSADAAATADLLKYLLEQSHSGQIKLYVIERALALRRSKPHLYQDGRYVPLTASGAQRQHLCAFARVSGDDFAITVVPRLVVGLTHAKERTPIGDSVLQDTALDLSSLPAASAYCNVLTAEQLPLRSAETGPQLLVKDILHGFPVALLSNLSEFGPQA